MTVNVSAVFPGKILLACTILLLFIFTSFGQPRIHSTRILVRFSSTATARGKNKVLSSEGLVVRHQFRLSRLAVLDAAPGRPIPRDIKDQETRIAQQIRSLRKSGVFDYVEPDFVLRASVLPNDSKFVDGTLWALRNTGQNGGSVGADIGVTNAWNLTTGSTNIIVAVIDTGINYTHQDLAAQMWQNPNEISGNAIDDDGDGYVDDVYGINAITGSGDPFDDNDHGTHVSGTIGAAANDGNPHVGVAWNVRLMACKFLDSSGRGYTSDAITCIEYAAAKGAKIMNNSWAGTAYSQALFDSISAVLQQGILFVTAAGNSSKNSDLTRTYPANYDLQNIISVAALDRNDQLAPFSNYGSLSVHLGAPGVDIFSCTHGSNSEYKTFSGTSMACPHVVGVAALVASRFPGISITELRQRLISTTVPISALNSRTVSGGRLNAYNALTAVPTGVPKVTVSPSATLPLLVGQTVNFSVSVSDVAAITNATVTANIQGFSNVSFHDDGIAPDLFSGDSIYSAAITVPDTNAFTISISVSAPGKSNVVKMITFPAQRLPVNDDFANRIRLTGDSVLAFGSNLGATSEPGEPNHNNGNASGKSVWWSWTAPSDTNVLLTTFYSSYDTVMALYTGNSVSNLNLIASNYRSPNGGPGWGDSLISFTAVKGTEYQIAVDGYSNYLLSDQGNLQLNLNQAPVFTLVPLSQQVAVGATVNLQAYAVGTPPVQFQWMHDSNPVPNGTNPILTIPSVSLADGGSYYLKATTAFGTAQSTPGTVSVTDATGHPAPGGLVGWWSAENNTLDNISGTNGTVSGALSFVPGVVHQAAQYNGNTFIAVPGSSNLNVGQGSGFTIEGWIKAQSDSLQQTLVEWSNGVSLQISVPPPAGQGPGCLFVEMPDTASPYSYFVSSTNVLNTNVFQHIAMTYEKATGYAKLYVNGNLVSLFIHGSFTAATASRLRIGKSFFINGTQPYTGIIDELSVYNRALTQDEIQSVWSAGSGGKLLMPVIYQQPSNQGAPPGQPVQFNVAASGADSLHYQWRKNAVPVSGATDLSYSIAAVSTDDAGTLDVVVTNGYGSATSAKAVLTVGSAPSITVNPASETLAAGNSVLFLVGANGANPLFYQWRLNGTNLTTATNTAYQISNVQASNAGNYSVFVSNAIGATISGDASLHVMVPQRLSLLGISSSQAQVGFRNYDGFPSDPAGLTNFVLQASTNLATWVELTNPVSITNGGILYDDDNRSNLPKRFYRVISH